MSIGTAVPAYKHNQEDILAFMERVYAPDESERRKLRFLYRQGGIQCRYSVIPDYSLQANNWTFYAPTENLEPFPSLEKRMEWFKREAGPLSLAAIHDCLLQHQPTQITHLITVSCTGLSAPGLDLELISALGLPPTISRVSVNFMGCYAASHALKLADAFCRSEEGTNVLVVCTEICTLHFQKELTVDNITSSMLFGDGSAAVLVSNDPSVPGMHIGKFYAKVIPGGNRDMAWQLSSSGFKMTLSSYVADLVAGNFNLLVEEALSTAHITRTEITNWCIHPGGKKILEAVHQSLGLTNGALTPCYEVLHEYGNMSSPTVLFVLQKVMQAMQSGREGKTFVAAFGPGLTMETLILRS